MVQPGNNVTTSKKNADISPNNLANSLDAINANTVAGAGIISQPGVALLLNSVPPFSVITGVKLTFSKELGRQSIGNQSVTTGALTNSEAGFEQSSTTVATGSSPNAEQRVSNILWVGERFTCPQQSVGSILLNFRARRPTGGNGGNTGDNLFVGIYTDGSNGAIPAPGSQIQVTDTEGISQGGWVSIPVSAITQSGGDSEGANPTTVDHWAEIQFQTPIGSQFLSSAGNAGGQYWAVFRTSGFNCYLAMQNGLSSLLNYDLINGSSGNWTWTLPHANFTPTEQVYLQGYAQLALTSAGSSYNGVGAPPEGLGCGLTVYDPASGQPYGALPVPGVSAQQQSYVQFKTSYVARMNSAGDVNVAFVVSAGKTAIQNLPNVSRLNYSLAVDYRAF